MKHFQMARRNDDAEILIYDNIGEDYWGGVSSKTFYEDLKDLGSVKNITVRINSEGGDLREGLAIYNHLKNAEAKKTIVIVDALAASAASLVAMAGDEIQIAKNAWFMVHNPQGITGGDYRHLESAAVLLKAFTENVAETYSNRTGTDSDEIKGMMDDETWMDSEQSMKLGFADTEVEQMAVAAKLDLTRWPNAPKALKIKADPDVIPSRLARMKRKVDRMVSTA